MEGLKTLGGDIHTSGGSGLVETARLEGGAYPELANEKQRLAALHSFHILDTAEDLDFDELTTLASAICQVPIALISLVDRDRQWFKSHHGLPARETPRDYSFCAHAIAEPGNMLIVPDAQIDIRFSSNPLVTGDPNIVFYAGVPLVDSEGFALGSLCVIDHQTRELASDQVMALKVLAKQVMDKLELRRKTAILADTKERLNLALDAASLGSYELDLHTGLMESNLQCRKNFGLDEDAVFNLDELLAAAADEYREYVKTQLNKAVDERSVFQAEFPVTWPDGSRHWIAASGRVRLDKSELPFQVVGVLQNITERKELDKRKDEFLGIVSHELKTPITTLKASLQLLESLKGSPGHVLFPVLMAKSARSADKINNLVDDLLNMHRFSENEMKMGRQWFNVYDLLRACADDKQAGNTIDILVEGDKQARVLADEHRVEQVIVNLLNNALKYAPNSSRITLDVETLQNFVRITVKDEGPGIPADHLPHLFNRYWRADHSSSSYSGLGLGLYICSEIVKRHGGEIGVHSSGTDGTNFWFTLPVEV